MRALLCCFALLLLLPECGGSGATSGEAKSAASDRKSADEPGESSAKSDDEEPSESRSASEKSKGLSCDDGTCSLCGSGICPAGWYCDEKVGGSGACSWLTECPEKPTCGCITRVLGSSCKCREENGGLKVACD
jgi:hypothetical protein